MSAKTREIIGNFEVINNDEVVSRREVLLMGAVAAGSLVAASSAQAAETATVAAATRSGELYTVKDFTHLVNQGMNGIRCITLNQTNPFVEPNGRKINIDNAGIFN